MGLRWTAAVAIAGTALIFAASEAGLRLEGAGAYPVCDVGGEIKYIPSANQHGIGRNRNEWHFNDRHMASRSNWSAEAHPNIVITGNSIVVGSLESNFDGLLGAQLAKQLKGHYAVWPVAAPGWSNVNEMAYFDRNGDVLRNADVVVIEFMEGGMSGPDPWPGYNFCPSWRPWSRIAHTLLRAWYSGAAFFAPRNNPSSPPAMGMPDENQLERFKEFVNGIPKASKLIMFFYPTIANLRDRAAWRRTIAPVMEICRGAGAKCIDFAEVPDWNEEAYLADGVHQTARGTKTLASVLANAINEYSEPKISRPGEPSAQP